jgi:hypothetical protein
MVKKTSSKAPKNSVMKSPMMGTKSMPKTTAAMKKMMAQEMAIEKKTAGKPKPAAEKKLEQKISKQLGKSYKGKR